jgi:hypothetical protein
MIEYLSDKIEVAAANAVMVAAAFVPPGVFIMQMPERKRFYVVVQVPEEYELDWKHRGAKLAWIAVRGVVPTTHDPRGHCPQVR